MNIIQNVKELGPESTGVGIVWDAQGVLPGVDDVGHDAVDAAAVFHLGEDERAFAAHLQRVSLHDREVRAHGGGEVDLVDDQEVALGDARPALARNLVTAGDVDDLDREVSQFPAEAGGEIIASGFDKKEVGFELPVKVFEGEKVCGDVFADGGMRAAAGFDGADTGRFQGVMAHEELTIFAGEDIVGDGSEVEAMTEVSAELEHQRRFSASDGSPDAHGKGSPLEVPVERAVPQMEMAGMIEVLVGVAVRAVVMGMTVGVRMRMGMRMRVGVIVARRMRVAVGHGGRGEGWVGRVSM